MKLVLRGLAAAIGFVGVVVVAAGTVFAFVLGVGWLAGAVVGAFTQGVCAVGGFC